RSFDQKNNNTQIKGRSLETGEEAAIEKSNKRGSNDTKELVNVLTSLDAASILTSGVQVVSVPSAAKVATTKRKKNMVESDTLKKKKLQEQIDIQVTREMEEQIAREDQRMSEQIARDAEITRIHAEEELQMLIDSLDRNNEMIANHPGWKIKHFKGMSLEEIKEKFMPVWKQIEDFIPMDSKEEGERVKRKWLRLEQESAKKRSRNFHAGGNGSPIEEGTCNSDDKQQAPSEKLLQMASDLIQKIDMIANSPRQRDGIPTASDEFPLPEDFPTASEERFPLLSYLVILGKCPMIDPEGIDYKEVFAPVARIKGIRLFLVNASFMGFMVYQMDVKSAFLYGTIEEEALHGLHHSPRAWYETLANYLLENGFHRGKIDQTLFIKKQKGDILLVQVYVDDIIFGSTNKELCKAFEKLMKDKFQMSLIGELTFFLGVQVKQKQDGIFISQDKYVAKLLRKFGLTNGKSASTHIDTKKPLLKDPDGEDVDVHTYRSMIG
nr:putative ribonuclease H-like domain-containing protein [Tanacetum cinerariifolium]